MNQKFWEKAVELDEDINEIIFNGTPDETMSARMGRAELRGAFGCCKWRYYTCKILSWIDPRKGDHCIESIEEDEK